MPNTTYDNFKESKKYLIKKIFNKNLAFFIDYDGTITPIVKHPDLANVSIKMRNCLRELAKLYPVSIISGRELKDVKAHIKLRSIYYAGNHGIEVSGPKLKKYFGYVNLEEIKVIIKNLSKSFKTFKNVLIENKKFSVSVHYRQADQKLIPRIQKIVNSELKNNDEFKKKRGKKVIEIYPNISWDKGKVVLWLINYLEQKKNAIFPIYLGDDISDEDAFMAIKDTGIGILVNPRKKSTYAQYSLKNSEEVYFFLKYILDISHEKLGYKI